MSTNTSLFSRVREVATSFSKSFFKEPEFDRWCRVLQDAPIDIVRLILEFAAELDRPTTASIALVSKEVSAWVTPMLYQTVVLSESSHVETFNQLMQDAIAAGASSSGLSKLQRTTTLILLVSGEDLPDPNLMKKTLTSLRSLHIHQDNAHGVKEYQVFPESLCQLVVCGWTIYRPAYNFLPIYTKITHLSFMHDDPRFFPEDLEKAFPNLTHFACTYRVRGERGDMIYTMKSDVVESLEFVLGRVLRLPTLRVALVLAQDFAMERSFTEEEMRGVLESVTESSSFKGDRRIVFVARHPSEDDQSRDMLDASAWDVRSESSFWGLAEKVVRDRGVEWPGYMIESV